MVTGGEELVLRLEYLIWPPSIFAENPANKRDWREAAEAMAAPDVRFAEISSLAAFSGLIAAEAGASEIVDE